MKSFYYVYNPLKSPPHNRHKTFNEAKTEAERLSLKHGCEIQILKCVAVSNVSDVSTAIMEEEEPHHRMLTHGEEINHLTDQYLELGEWTSYTDRNHAKYYEPPAHLIHRRPITPNNQ